MPRISAPSLLLLSCLTAGCSGSQYVASCKDATQAFHRDYNATDYRHIFANADEGFRGHGTAREFVDFVTRLREQVGAHVDSELTGQRVDVGTSGVIISLVYVSRFQHGKMIERFAWRIQSGTAKLYGYHTEPR